MNDDAIAVLREAEGVLEAYRKRTYVCYRTAAAGHVQEVTVDVLDAGPAAPRDKRYSCTARSDDGRFAAADHAASAEAAVRGLRWAELDRED